MKSPRQVKSILPTVTRRLARRLAQAQRKVSEELPSPRRDQIERGRAVLPAGDRD